MSVNLDELMELVTADPGIDRQKVTEHFKLYREDTPHSARSKMHRIQKKLKKVLFVQSLGVKRKYYTVEYATKHNVPQIIVTPRAMKCRADRPTSYESREETNWLTMTRVIDQLWPTVT